MSASKIAVPLAFLGTVFGFGVTWSQVAEHHKDEVVHLERKMAVMGGGPAFKNEVSHTEQRLTRKIEDEGRQMRALMRKMKIRCRFTKSEGELSCRTELPEDNE